MVSSRTFSEHTFLWNGSRKVLNTCPRTVLEQTNRIFLKLSSNHSKYLLEKYWDTYRMLYLIFYGACGGWGGGMGGVLQLFFKVCKL